MQSVLTILVIIVGVMALMSIYIFVFYFRLWTRAAMSGHRVPISVLMAMKLRRVPPGLILDCYIRAQNGDLYVSMEQLEKHYLAGGNPARVVDALIKTHNRNIAVPFEIVAKTDLAGFNVDEVDPEEFRKVSSQPEAG
jgi:uncharacterized protein YqfA (UPF0365 family)